MNKKERVQMTVRELPGQPCSQKHIKHDKEIMKFDQVMKEPGEDYIRFLMDWHNSIRH